MTIDPEIKKRLIGLESTYDDVYPVQVQGESSYRSNIETICGYVDEEEGYSDDSHKAFLYFEDDNQYDPGNAVRVEIDDLTVGYLSKPQAKAYRQKLKEIGAPENPIAICGASIKGGFRKRSGEVADYGVRLDFDLPNLALVPVREKPLEQAPPRVVEKTIPASVPTSPNINKAQPASENLPTRLLKWMIKKPSNILAAVLIALFAITAAIISCQILSIVLTR